MQTSIPPILSLKLDCLQKSNGVLIRHFKKQLQSSSSVGAVSGPSGSPGGTAAVHASSVGSYVATAPSAVPAPEREIRATVETACALDCPDACSLEVEVVDGRVERIAGTHRHPLTAGFICGKVRRFADEHCASFALALPPNGMALVRIDWEPLA